MRLEQHQDANEAGERDAVEEDVAQDRALDALLAGATPPPTMLCASIILPITPPELLDAAASTGDMPIWPGGEMHGGFTLLGQRTRHGDV